MGCITHTHKLNNPDAIAEGVASFTRWKQHNPTDKDYTMTRNITTVQDAKKLFFDCIPEKHRNNIVTRTMSWDPEATEPFRLHWSEADQNFETGNVYTLIFEAAGESLHGIYVGESTQLMRNRPWGDHGKNIRLSLKHLGVPVITGKSLPQMSIFRAVKASVKVWCLSCPLPAVTSKDVESAIDDALVQVPHLRLNTRDTQHRVHVILNGECAVAVTPQAIARHFKLTTDELLDMMEHGEVEHGTGCPDHENIVHVSEEQKAVELKVSSSCSEQDREDFWRRANEELPVIAETQNLTEEHIENIRDLIDENIENSLKAQPSEAAEPTSEQNPIETWFRNIEKEKSEVKTWKSTAPKQLLSVSDVQTSGHIGDFIECMNPTHDDREAKRENALLEAIETVLDVCLDSQLPMALTTIELLAEDEKMKRAAAQALTKLVMVMKGGEK